MRSLLVVAVVVSMFVPIFPVEVEATGGSQQYRFLTHGDYYFGPMRFGSCRPGSQLETNPTCWVLHENLGYDGWTSGFVDWGRDGHLNHAFSCAVTSSATGIIGNSLPFPGNMVHGDSIQIVFDRNGDGLADPPQYGGRGITPQPAWLTIYLQHALASGDPNQVVGAFTRYAGEVQVSGPTPTVSGNVDGPSGMIFNEATDDVTVECVF